MYVGYKEQFQQNKNTGLQDIEQLEIDNTIIEILDSFIYLAHKIMLKYDNQQAEIGRQIRWFSANCHKYCGKENSPRARKPKCMTTVLLYVVETMIFTEKIINKLRNAEKTREKVKETLAHHHPVDRRH